MKTYGKFDGLSSLGKRSVKKQLALMFPNDKKLLSGQNTALWLGSDGFFLAFYTSKTRNPHYVEYLGLKLTKASRHYVYAHLGV